MTEKGKTMSTLEHTQPARLEAAQVAGTTRTRSSARGNLRARRRLRFLPDLLLWTTASAGVLFAVLAVLSSLLGCRVMLFATGSMSPTIPAGSAALVVPVPAAEVRTGDVVTIERGQGRLPVTHRVVSVSTADSPDKRLLTLRGDANAENDPSPYEVSEVDRVVVSVPAAASTISWLGRPVVLAPLGIAAAGFVVWGLWPRGRDTGDRR